jgi:hypothetical protein
MRDGWLLDVAAGGEVAGADLGCAGQLAKDGKARRIRKGLEEPDVGVCLGRSGSRHRAIVSIGIYIDKYQYYR